MTINQIRQTFRLLFKEKRITIINITGLSISLACALFMLLWGYLRCHLSLLNDAPGK